MEKTFKIIDPIGLHARPVAKLSKVAANYNDEVTIVNLRTRGTGNLKSILSVMSLGVKTNDEIKIVVKGSKAEEILEVLEKEMKEDKLI